MDWNLNINQNDAFKIFQLISMASELSGEISGANFLNFMQGREITKWAKNTLSSTIIIRLHANFLHVF